VIKDQVIVLLNVEDDTVVKSLDGHFGPISRNLNLHWNQGESK